MSQDKNNQLNKEMTKRDENFANWYTDIVLKAKLSDYGPVKGTMIMRPYGYAIWENIVSVLDKRIKDAGHQNVYFPTLFPKSFLAKEADHIEGFAPEVHQITSENGVPLQDPLVLRPTSEVIICDAISRWVQSYRDLPVAINQWANIFRLEKTTRPFLRTSEFLWQEGHYFASTLEEAKSHTIRTLNMYVEFFKDTLAIDVLNGRKSDKEKFAGAVTTYTVEAMMQDGRALQAGTSHVLGDGFSKSFDIKFLDKDGELKYTQNNSFGVSTRLIGALIMVHGDDKGLVLPPRVAPTQVIIIPIASHTSGVIEKCEELEKKLKEVGYKVELDKRDLTPGFKFNDAELRGIPLRIELGPKDIANNSCVLVKRVDEASKNLKQVVLLDELTNKIKISLNEIHDYLYLKSKNNLASNTTKVKDFNELENALNNKKFADAHWCLDPKCELNIKERTSATIRVLVDEKVESNSKCVVCNKPSKTRVIIAKSY